MVYFEEIWKKMDDNKNKIKVGFIHNSQNMFLTGNHFDNTYFHFFMEAIRRHDKLDVTDIIHDDILDARTIDPKFDLLMLWENSLSGMPKDIIGLEELHIPIISKVGDPNRAKGSIPFHKKWHIDHYFHYYPESLFYSLYPKNFNFTTIRFGIETKLYQNITPFDDRIKNTVLNSGAVGTKKIISQIINSIRNPKWNANRYYYLRTKCNELPYVSYTPTLNHEYVGDNYPRLLEKYASAIAAGSYETPIKYWEIPAAGCLTFMEITEKNYGKHLGFIDDETSIFINKNNYHEKFNEYLSDLENPKWKKIANAGREYVLNNFNNDVAANNLVKLIETLVY